MVLENLKVVKDAVNLKNIAERMSCFVIDDLADDGFECELIKPKKSPKSWKIIPKKNLSDKEKQRFETLKKKYVDMWRNEERGHLKDVRRIMFGR